MVMKMTKIVNGIGDGDCDANDGGDDDSDDGGDDNNGHGLVMTMMVVMVMTVVMTMTVVTMVMVMMIKMTIIKQTFFFLQFFSFARFQELIAIQTEVGARQQDLFYNNDTFKPSSMAKVSTYPDTTVC